MPQTWQYALTTLWNPMQNISFTPETRKNQKEAEEKKGGDHVETKQSCFNSHLSDSIHYLPAKHGALVAPMRARTSKQKRIHLYSRPCQLIRHPFCRQMDLEFIAENTAA